MGTPLASRVQVSAALRIIEKSWVDLAASHLRILVHRGAFLRTHNSAEKQAAISAACHVLPEEVKNSHLLPIRWAVVEVDEFAIRHCAFTTKSDDEISDLEPGCLYR